MSKPRNHSKNKSKKTNIDSIQKKTNKIKIDSASKIDTIKPKAFVSNTTKLDLKSKLHFLDNFSTWQNPDFRKKFSAISWSFVGIAITIGIMFVAFPYLFSQTEAAKNYNTQKEENQKIALDIAEKEAILKAEEPFIQGDNPKVELTTEFGNIVIETRRSVAPKTVESFLRLTHRGYFDSTIFHRIVKQPDFSVIQGGDPSGTGAGGESAFGQGQTIPDELWLVSPEFAPDESGQMILSNEPKLQGEDLYRNLDLDTGTVTYPKGSVVMAKTSAPNSAGSQFFITLTDTILPAQYTIFGTITPDSILIIDKIYNEVNAKAQANIDGSFVEVTDGTPDKEIKIIKASILK